MSERGLITITKLSVTEIGDATRATSTTTTIVAEAPLDVNSFNVINQSFTDIGGETAVKVGLVASGGLKITLTS